MTHPQKQPMEPARPVSEAERAEAKRHLQSLEESKRDWWTAEAPKMLREAVNENVDEATAQRIVDAASQSDWCAVGAILWAAVGPYLDDQCQRAHDQTGNT